jgi:peroxiredoxin
MLKRMFLGLALALASVAAQAAAPDIVLRDLDGKPRNINEFIGQGKWIIVAVWAHDCHICAEEIHEMSALHQARNDKDAAVLGVSIDGMEKLALARGFADRHRLPFMNLVAEPEKEVLLRFGGGPFIGTPSFYFFDPAGRIVARNVGPTTRKDVEAFIESFNK